MRNVKAVTFAWVVLALTGVLTSNMTAESDSGRALPLQAVEHNARAARGGDAKAIRKFVDVVLDESLFTSAPESVRARLAAAEHHFQHAAHDAVTEERFVAAINETVESYDMPEHVSTTLAQVHLFRQLLRQMAPSAIGLARNSSEMSPAEAAFVAVNLASQKLINPDYQVPPDEWVRSVGTHRAASAPQTRLTKTDSRSATLADALVSAARGENSVTAAAMHSFLDRAGVQRK